MCLYIKLTLQERRHLLSACHALLRSKPPVKPLFTIPSVGGSLSASEKLAVDVLIVTIAVEILCWKIYISGDVNTIST